MFQRIAALVAVMLIAVVSVFGQGIQVTITSPTDGTLVPWRLCIHGTVSDPTAQVWIVTHPLDVGDFWIQPAVTVRRDGRWKLQTYIARQRARVYSGKFFEIKAIVNPKQPLHETKNTPLSAWPEAEAASDIVEVIRDDGAATGCQELWQRAAIGQSAHPSPRVPVRSEDGTALKPQSAGNEEQPSSIASQTVKHVSGSMFLWVLITVVPFLFWLVLAWLPDRTGGARKALWGWLSKANQWLWGYGPKAKGSVVNCRERVFDWSGGQQSRIWRRRGHEGDLKGLCRKAFACPFLLVFFWFALYADAMAILSGLPLIFSSGHSQQVGAIGSLYAADPESAGSPSKAANESAGVQSRGTEESQGTSRYIFLRIKSVATLVLNPFKKVWEGTDLGFMAIGLAAVQAALGLVFLWEIPTEQSLANRPREFLGQRPIPFSCFLVFDLGLGLLAGYRGFELGTGESIWMPAALSCVIGLVMPWIEAYMLHLFFECASDWLGPVTAFVLGALMLASACISVLAWSLILAVVGTMAGVIFILCNVLLGLPIVLLWTAEVFGDFVRAVHQWISGEGRPGHKRAPTANGGTSELSLAT